MAGLTDGLLACDYIPRLAAGLDRVGYSLVQPVLSSSYKGEKPTALLVGSRVCVFVCAL